MTRWLVRFALALGVAASIAANVLHARPDVTARVASAWAPVALLVTVEIVARVAVSGRGWVSGARMAATFVVAAVAAWASYWHMVSLAIRVGEGPHIVAWLLPLSVDGLIVVASICLVQMGPALPGLRRRPGGGEGGDPDGDVTGDTAGDLSPPRSGRAELARLLAEVPADDGRSDRQLAADLGPRVGLAESSARRYIAAFRSGGDAG